MTLLREIDSRKRGASVKRASKHQDASGHKRSSAGDHVDIDRGYAILVSIALTIVHATLAVLARAQYGQDIEPWAVARESLRALPIFLILVNTCSRLPRKVFVTAGFAGSITCGCYIVYLFNTEGYYASMSVIPAIGSIWVWLFIELDWYFGLATLGIVGVYTYVKGFSLV